MDIVYSLLVYHISVTLTCIIFQCWVKQRESWECSPSRWCLPQQ